VSEAGARQTGRAGSIPVPGTKHSTARPRSEPKVSEAGARQTGRAGSIPVPGTKFSQGQCGDVAPRRGSLLGASSGLFHPLTLTSPASSIDSGKPGGGVSEHEKQWISVVGEEGIEIPVILPVLPVRDAVAFPGLNVSLVIGRPASLAALDQAGQGGFLVVATQKDPTTESPGLEDLHPVACVTRVLRIVDARREGKQAIVMGLIRTRFRLVESAGAALLVHVDPLIEPPEDSAEIEAARQHAIELAHRVIDLRADYPDEWKGIVSQLPSPGLLADLITSNITLPVDERVELLAEASPSKRLRRLARHLEREITIAETQRALEDESAGDEMDPKHRERLLRRRMRAIEAEI